MPRSLFPKRLHGIMDQYTSLRYLGWFLESLPLALLWLIASLLPVRVASALGASLLGLIGPHTHKNKHVLANLRTCFPDADHVTLDRIARTMWRNLGAVFTEYPHLKRILNSRVELQIDPQAQTVLKSGKPLLVMAPHLANWELIAEFLAYRNIPLTVVYKRQDNPFIESMIQHFRRADDSFYVGNEDALKAMMQATRKGRSLGLLPDQRVDSGLMLPLFGENAATTISPVRIAQRAGYALVPFHVERLPGCRFRLIVSAPLSIGTDVAETEQVSKDSAIDIMLQFNKLLECWIHERPGEWLCTKRRWPKKAFLRNPG